MLEAADEGTKRGERASRLTKHMTDLPQDEQGRTAAETVLSRVHGAARLAGFGTRPGRAPPRLPAPDERRLAGAARGIPAVVLQLVRGTRRGPVSFVHALDHADVFTTPIVCSAESEASAAAS